MSLIPPSGSTSQRTKRINYAKQTQFLPFLRQKLTFRSQTNPKQTQSNPIFRFFHLAYAAYLPQSNPTCSELACTEYHRSVEPI